QAVAPLIQRVQADPEPEVRRVAAAALGMIGSPRAVPALQQALQDREVQAVAQQALAKLKAKWLG
ncbi:MAG: hypothetical protein GTN65_08055, partial [Armatimonadetes bacterium]|nr:hypothetical protein [Armatimonadota bacterium]NIO97039.1 hypothetical protein [Armatimonadota bacterium]